MRSFALAIAVSVLAGSANVADLGAQQLTTATIAGVVRGDRQELVDGAVVRVSNGANGYSFNTTTRLGRFIVLGLPVGGPYTVVVARIGYHPAKRDLISLALGEQLQLDFVLSRFAASLDTLRVASVQPPGYSFARHGIGTEISDSSLHRLPTIDRDLYDFVRLSPQVSARSGRVGLSAGGVGVRFNNFLVDGVSERGLLGNFAAGTGQGAKAISIEAVREYQVLLSPYDVRYGDFAGALVNAVTRSGTNEVHGSAFVYGRDEALARGTDFIRGSPYQRTQFGFTLGGPLARDRAHFFLASELQRLTSPATGPYIGQSPAREVAVPVSEGDVTRFVNALRRYGIEPGSAGPIEVGNPLVNLFARIDVALPEWNSRLVLWNNYSRADNGVFARGNSTSFLTRGTPAFQLSSTGSTSIVSKDVAAAQLYTHVRHGGLNEFLIALKFQPSHTTPNERAPSVSVAVPSLALPGRSVSLQAGSDEAAHGISLAQTSLEVTDHFAFSLGTRHRAAVGARVELLELNGRGRPGIYGSWDFSSLDDLDDGRPARYRLVTEPRNRKPQRAGQYSFYVTDEWRPGDRVTVLAGLRAELLARRSRPPYNAAVDSLFGRRTSDIGRKLFHVSPRIGFGWDVLGDGRSHVRGGVGLFVARPPMGWLGSGFNNYGSGTGELVCAADAGAGLPPRFIPDYQHQPDVCADGSGLSDQPRGPVNLQDGDLRMTEAFRTSLAYDHFLPGRVIATVEALYTRNLSDFAFVNLNLKGPQSVDRHGRVLYGTIRPDGRAEPVPITQAFPEVIDLQNHSKNYSLQLAVRLEKRFSDRLEATASYAYSRVRDVQTPPDAFQAGENWRRGRVVSGLHEAMSADISALDIPHHVVLAGTFTAPWRRWVTDFSFYYVGESGSPLTYVATSDGRKGDLNADGTNLNDPIYIPRTALDSSEILFRGTSAEIAAQQADFERFIESTECLRRQRGRIMSRNSCRAPWVHITNASVRQTIPVVRGHTVAVQLDVFNVLNLLNKEWGLFRVPNTSPNPRLLEHVGQTAGSAATAQPTFRLDRAATRFDSGNVQSAFQLQLGVRYSF